MLENYTITNVNSEIMIKCNRCGSQIVTNKITANIIDIHDSYNIVVQFLLLNGFCIAEYDECLLFNNELDITMGIYINKYHIGNNSNQQYFNNSSELLEYLKERLDIHSTNKIVKNE